MMDLSRGLVDISRPTHVALVPLQQSQLISTFVGPRTLSVTATPRMHPVPHRHRRQVAEGENNNGGGSFGTFELNVTMATNDVNSNPDFTLGLNVTVNQSTETAAVNGHFHAADDVHAMVSAGVAWHISTQQSYVTLSHGTVGAGSTQYDVNTLDVRWAGQPLDASGSTGQADILVSQTQTPQSEGTVNTLLQGTARFNVTSVGASGEHIHADVHGNGSCAGTHLYSS